MHLGLHTIRTFLPAACLTAILFGPSVGRADDTLHNAYQAVNSSGTSTWTATGAITMTGVVINNPGDMLYYSDDSSSPYYSTSPQWQVYFQASEDAKINDGDFGGTAMYMRRYHPMSSTDLFPGTDWADEISRLNYPLYDVTGTEVAEPLRRGDLIQVTANAPGMFFGGKKNINTEHKGTSTVYESGESYEDYLFSIVILQRDVELTASDIELSDLKDENNDFIFDEDRDEGCEHYQGSLVHLDNLLLVDPANWALDGEVTVTQNGLTFGMKLGIDPDLLSVDANSLENTPFSVTAILDQETPRTGPFTESYRLWLTNAGDLIVAVPEPGTVVLAIVAMLALLPWRRPQRRGR